MEQFKLFEQKITNHLKSSAKATSSQSADIVKKLSGPLLLEMHKMKDVIMDGLDSKLIDFFYSKLIIVTEKGSGVNRKQSGPLLLIMMEPARHKKLATAAAAVIYHFSQQLTHATQISTIFETVFFAKPVGSFALPSVDHLAKLLMNGYEGETI
jgi:hypothetical protein